MLVVPGLAGLALVLLVAWPLDVARGLATVFSERDVVQVASGMDTGVTLLAAVLAVGGLCRLLGLRLPERLGFALLLYGWFLWVPTVALLGLGAEYGLAAVLAARGYGYCTFHVTDTGRGSDGTYVYVRTTVPDGCAAARAVFPPGKLVADRRGAFDLPPPSRGALTRPP